MPPRTLASLAYALSVAPDLDAALVALGEGLADLDRSAVLALYCYDGRRQMLTERMVPVGGKVVRGAADTTFDHLPPAIQKPVLAGGQFVELADQSGEYARLLGIGEVVDGGQLVLRGLLFDGVLEGVLAIYEQRKIFGARTSERISPAVSLFELGYARFQEREARQEAVRTLEDVTQRVHGDYLRKLSALEQELGKARGEANRGGADPAQLLEVEQDAARAREEARRATRKTNSLEQQLMEAVGQLERAHIELHRRSESLRQKTRTLYLIDRVLTLDGSTDDPRQLVDGLLSLVGDDMQVQRCSLVLRAPEPGWMYLAAARGIAPHITEGQRIEVGHGVSGRVAASREPILVEDVTEANQHPLLQDQYFTTGSFISFPLVYHNELVGVLNLTNRAQHGMFFEEDVERVRLLALVISLVASHARLPDRLLETIGVR